MEGRESVAATGAAGGGGGANGEGIGGAAATAAAAPGKEEARSPTPSPTPSPPTAAGESAAAAALPMGMGMGAMGMMGMGVLAGSGGEDLVRKKRGRPRKYGPEGSGMALALSPTSPFSPCSVGKRGRGRPPGSGRRQLLAALGEWFALSAGWNFTPHVVTIAAGEDVTARILSFSQKGPRSICILSANGAISNVTLRQPGSSGGTLTFEGRFEILSLSGSFTVTENGGVRSRTGGISVSLAGPDGRVIGGGVAGLLLAASPIQVVVGSFVPNTLKELKRKATPEPSTSPAIPASGVLAAARPISQANPDDDCETPTSAVQGQNHGEAEDSMSNIPNTNSTSFHGMGWQGLQSSSEHKPSPDINITLPGE